MWWLVVIIVIAVFIVVTLVRTFVRRRSGRVVIGSDGKGPAVQWFPRFMRPRVNRWFERRGWPKPYDTELNKIPRSQRL